MRGRWTRRIGRLIGRLIVPLAAAATIACAAASDGVESPISPAPAVPAGWQTYTNPLYGFAVSYPAEFGIVVETTPPPGGAAARVRFQVKELLTSAFVDREPARFTVEVFFGDQATTLAAWLRSNNRLPAGAVTSTFALAGAAEGLKVQQRQQLAPNEFYYFSSGRYIFAVTPLGEHSAGMLASFRLI